MKAEIIAVGTEILLGNIVNTNAQYISQRLADLGIEVYHQSVIGDNAERLKGELKNALTKADLVITTGGLGPTDDDLTKETIFNYFNEKPVLNEESLENIKKYFKRLNKDMPMNNVKQAYFPEKAIIMPNNNGTAPGCILEEENKIIAVFPGPPKEMIPMFEESFVPYIKKFQTGILYSKVYRIAGIGESRAVEIVKDIIDNQSNPTIAPYAKEGEVTFRVTAKAKNIEEAKKIITPIDNELKERFGINLYGFDGTSLEAEIAKILINNNITISTAESCTGGLLAGRLINYPGISSVYLEGVITYSNEAKMKRIGVKRETLDKYGAVSSQTAEEMARGIAVTAGTDVGISTTGIAGPSGGTLEKPVGLVYIGVYIKGKTKTLKLNLSGSRQKIRNLAVINGLDFLRRQLIKLGYK